MTPTPPRPPYEPATALVLQRLEAAGGLPPLNSATLPARRLPVAQRRAAFLAAHPEVRLREETLTREDGTAMPLTVVLPPDDEVQPGAPLLLSIHGGGRVMGCRFDDLAAPANWARCFGGIVVAPEYRLAPEHPAPAAGEDCLAALTWAAAHAADYGADPERIVVVGPSGGGGLAACLALAARDRGGPRALGYLLDYPMLDDRTGLPGPDGTVQPPSARQFPDDGLWPAQWNDWAWEQILPGRRGGSEVSEYEAAGRAVDQPGALAGLPPVFLSVADAETFRDEVVAFAAALWRDGGDCELHVWPGATHAMEYVSTTWLRDGLEAARLSWLTRLLEPEDPRLNLSRVMGEGTFPTITAAAPGGGAGGELNDEQ
ncbi:alpha/beta hydrolase [Actinomyces sp. 565]|uniref:alpha/beta hydrolase fold domain-containing protein n=1 Tax=Actinomyces sp. 565 TaxID=2057794 RepID=UPI0013A69863|nr:alpha/beta hydrolase [Actinomyces sp. 565]NDR54421.1 alpha/beta hydrolase fold domain-containing protein [Actinomyces sp. 565]